MSTDVKPTGCGRARLPPTGAPSTGGRDSPAILAFYLVYSGIRDFTGRESSEPSHAFHHASQIDIWLERHLGIFHEATIQHGRCTSARSSSPGTTCTGRCTSSSRSAWPCGCTAATATTIRDFATRWRSPPGSRSSGSQFSRSCRRGCSRASSTRSPRTRRSGRSIPAPRNVSNQFAAMPSVHIAWSTWCALALGPRVKNRPA